MSVPDDLRAEELYSTGLMITACLMMVNTRIRSNGWMEGFLGVLAGCLGILFGRAMAKHLGRDLMPVMPSSAMLMMSASFIVCAIGAVSGLPLDPSTCMAFNYLGLAIMLHFRPPPSPKDRRRSDQSLKVASVVKWKGLAVVLVSEVMSMIVGTSLFMGLLAAWPSRFSGIASSVGDGLKGVQ